MVDKEGFEGAIEVEAMIGLFYSVSYKRHFDLLFPIYAFNIGAVHSELQWHAVKTEAQENWHIGPTTNGYSNGPTVLYHAASQALGVYGHNRVVKGGIALS